MRSWQLAFTAATALALASGARADDGCDIPLDAAMKLNDMSYHITMTSSVKGGQKEVSEIITIGDMTYVKIAGTWHQGPKEDLTIQDIEDAGVGLTCSLLRSESVGGHLTDVWKVEDVSDPDEVKHQTVWIAKDTGLLTRMEIDVDEDGEPASSHTSAEIDYKDVAPPH